MLKDIRNFVNGAVYGITLIIPGVSATIRAIILGFYDELLSTLNHFREDTRKNTRYMAMFLFGIAAGSVVCSSIISYLLANYSLPTMLFFTGLLAGIVPFIFLKTKSTAKESALKMAPREIALAIAAMLALFALSRLVDDPTVNPTEAISAINPTLVFFVFFAGILNGATLVIPGLSGAFILLIMGLYPLVVYSISSVGTFLGDMGNLLLLRDICMILLPFGIGGLIGCLFMARIMEKLMRNFLEAVYAVILGLVLGSIITLLSNPLVYQSGTSTMPIIAGLITFCVGCTTAYILGKRM
jgi:putative membrane protein